MAIENFKQFKEPINTHIEYFCADDRRFFPKDSEVVLFSWNRVKDVKDNPTDALEKKFFARKAIAGEDDSIVYFGKVKVNGKWEDSIISCMEVPYELKEGYIVFWEVRRKHDQVWFLLDEKGQRVTYKPKVDTYWPKIDGIGFRTYDWGGRSVYEDEDLIENFVEDYDEFDPDLFKKVIQRFLEIHEHPYITIGFPPKIEEQKTTSEKVN